MKKRSENIQAKPKKKYNKEYVKQLICKKS